MIAQDLGTIAVVGGTGDLGSAIAGRLARAGRTVIVGSRTADTAQATAAQLGHGVTGAVNEAAAQAADIIIVTVPFAAQAHTLAQIAPFTRGKLVVDTTVPLVPPRVMRVQLPPEGSAALCAQTLLGEGTTVVSAFHNVSAHKLGGTEPVECDVLVFGDDTDMRAKGVTLVEDCGLRGFHGGSLANSAAAEAMTSVLIFINKAYGIKGAGIQISGSPGGPQ